MMFIGQRITDGLVGEAMNLGIELYADRLAEIATEARDADEDDFQEKILNGDRPAGFLGGLGNGLWSAMGQSGEAGRRETRAYRKQLKTAKASLDLDWVHDDVSISNLELDFFRLRAFTIAHIEDQAILGRVKGTLDRILQEGGTYQDFRTQVLDLVPQTISEGHLQTIFQTNLQTAYNAGKYYEGMDAVAELPYWQYKTVGDDRVRPAHAALADRVWPKTAAVWDVIFPPNGFNCRCTVIEWDEISLRRAGLKPEISLPPEGQPDPGFESNAAQAQDVMAGLAQLHELIERLPKDYKLAGMETRQAAIGEKTVRWEDDLARPRRVPKELLIGYTTDQILWIAQTMTEPMEIWGWPGRGLTYLATYETAAGVQTVVIEMWGGVRNVQIVPGNGEQFRRGLLIQKR
jgi:SPP1 gp7 family putative phage head morphogenesis protein